MEDNIETKGNLRDGDIRGIKLFSVVNEEILAILFPFGMDRWKVDNALFKLEDKEIRLRRVII